MSTLGKCVLDRGLLLSCRSFEGTRSSCWKHWRESEVVVSNSRGIRGEDGEWLTQLGLGIWRICNLHRAKSASRIWRQSRHSETVNCDLLALACLGRFQAIGNPMWLVVIVGERITHKPLSDELHLRLPIEAPYLEDIVFFTKVSS